MGMFLELPRRERERRKMQRARHRETGENWETQRQEEMELGVGRKGTNRRRVRRQGGQKTGREAGGSPRNGLWRCQGWELSMQQVAESGIWRHWVSTCEVLWG